MVAADAEKEDLLRAALPFIAGRAEGDRRRVRAPGVPRRARSRRSRRSSWCRRWPTATRNSLVHLYQCLANAARLGLSGVVAEFGMFKGGTTMFLSRVIERLGASWPVIGFDTFGGFPPRRSPLDMYDHPGCVFTDLAAVRRYLDGRDIEIVAGDIAATCRPAGRGRPGAHLHRHRQLHPRQGRHRGRAAIAPCRAARSSSTTSPAPDRFRYTLGERIAGQRAAR